MTRASEEILRTVPDSLREGSLALGAPRWRLVQRVVLPTALTGLVTAVILGVARAIGETAPMLLTAFGSDSTVTRPERTVRRIDLPLFVWKLIRSPVNAQVATRVDRCARTRDARVRIVRSWPGTSRAGASAV